MSCLKLFGAFILVSLVSVCHGTLSRGLSLIDSNLFITDMMLEDVKNEVAAQSQSNVTACWKDSFDRGVGKPISACPPGDEKSGLLCYPFCDAGYTGVGPVCWEECKPGYTDTGAFCTRPGSIVPADTSECPWYDKCGLTLDKGCSTCPAHTPAYHNDGCTCRVDPDTYAKKSYGRGAGSPLVCPPNMQEQAALCYVPCKSGYSGVGPFCWEVCPSLYPADDGALCCDGLCSPKIADMAKAVLEAVVAALAAGEDPQLIINAVKAAIEAVLGFVLPICK